MTATGRTFAGDGAAWLFVHDPRGTQGYVKENLLVVPSTSDPIQTSSAGDPADQSTLVTLTLDPSSTTDLWTTSVYPNGSSDGRPAGLDNDELRVGGWGDTYISYLRFPTPVADATRVWLELFNDADEGSPTDMIVRAASSSWSAGADDRLGWAEQPALAGQPVVNVSVVAARGWVRIDITPIVMAWRAGQPNHGIALSPRLTNNNFNEFVSTEGQAEYRPRLLIERPEGPPAPSIPATVRVPNACPFEGCVLGGWIAREPVPIFDAINGRRIGILRVGQAVSAIEGEVRAVPRRAVVTRLWESDRNGGLRVGSIVHVLHPAGEGSVVLLHQGNIIHGSLDLGLRYDRPLDVQPLDWTWWVKVRLADGRQVWVRNPQGAFDGADQFS